MIKSIIFDCFGVLTADTWHEFLDTLDKADIQAARDIHREYDAGHMSKQACARRITQITGRSFTELEDILDGRTDKNSRLLKYIAELKTTYKIGLLSNVGNNWIRDYFLTPQEKELFDAFVFSFEAGTTKPDPRIFEMMLDKLGVKPGEAVMVDDIERYAEAAKAIGMEAVCYRDFDQFKADLGGILFHT